MFCFFELFFVCLTECFSNPSFPPLVVMTLVGAESEGQQDPLDLSTSPDAGESDEENEPLSDSSDIVDDDADDDDDFDDDDDESVVDEDEEDSEIRDEEEEHSEIEDEDTDYESEDDETWDGNDDSFYDNTEQELVEGQEYEAAELYMRRKVNEYWRTVTALREHLTKTQKTVHRLKRRERVLKGMFIDLRDEKRKLEEGQDLTLRVMEKNQELKRQLQAATEMFMSLQTEVQSLLQSEDELNKTEKIQYLGLKVTLLGGEVARQDVFDIEPLLNEAKSKERTANELMEKMEQSRMEVIRLSKNEELLLRANRALSSANQDLEETVKEFGPCLSAERQEANTQRQMNSRLEQRNRHLEEQLRRTLACAGPAFGAGEQTLMERARGVPGVFEGIPLTVTQK